ncbi:MAG TPA: hypothetical protein VN714_30175 [Trebonia sp.]|jgi:hypothetical protein|nr:hypothetical protein [Trebonia sp.]
MAIALAVMLAPQPGVGVFVMVFSVGHIGTAAPVMLTWLVLDRRPGWTRRRGRRWSTPLVVGLLLAWALMADPLVLVVAIIPLFVVVPVRLSVGSRPRLQNGSGLHAIRRAMADRWLEAALVPAAAAACLLA